MATIHRLAHKGERTPKANHASVSPADGRAPVVSHAPDGKVAPPRHKLKLRYGPGHRQAGRLEWISPGFRLGSGSVHWHYRRVGAVSQTV